MYRVTTQFLGIPGTPAYNQLNFLGSGVQAEASACHAAVTALWNAIDALIATPATCTVLGDVAEVDEATGQVTAVYPVAPTNNSFAGPGDMQPYVCQGLVRLRTGSYLNGREIRGRVFIPGTMDTSDLDGTPNPAYTGALTTAFNNLVTDSTTAGIPLGVWSPTRGVIARVTGANAWNQWAVLRSRRP